MEEERLSKNKNVIEGIKELGCEILSFARKQPQLTSELTGIFEKVSRLVISSEDSISEPPIDDRRLTATMLQTLKDFLPPSLRCCSSIRSFS